MTTNELAKAEAEYNEAADRMANATPRTEEYAEAFRAEIRAWNKMMALRFTPGTKVLAWGSGRQHVGTVVKFDADGYVTVKMDMDRGQTTRIFANQLLVA